MRLKSPKKVEMVSTFRRDRHILKQWQLQINSRHFVCLLARLSFSPCILCGINILGTIPVKIVQWR